MTWEFGESGNEKLCRFKMRSRKFFQGDVFEAEDRCLVWSGSNMRVHRDMWCANY